MVRLKLTISVSRTIPLRELGGQPTPLSECPHVLLHALPPAPLLGLPADKLDPGAHCTRPVGARHGATTSPLRTHAHHDDVAARAQVRVLRLALGEARHLT